MRILLVVNPRSRGGVAARRIPAVISALEERASVAVLEADANTARAVADRLAAGAWDRVVALGGDGTFARVADGVLEAGGTVPMAFLPAGLANNHGRGFGLPTVYDGMGAVDAVFGEASIAMDVAWLGEMRFYDTVGFGLQAAALARREAVKHRPLLGGELGYAAGALLTLGPGLRFAAELTVDGRQMRWPAVLDVVVSNSVWYGGRWILDRDARVDDGILEVVGVRGWRDLVRHGVLDGWGGTADVRGSEIELRFTRPVASQVDGEVGPVASTHRIRVERAALTLMLPVA